MAKRPEKRRGKKASKEQKAKKSDRGAPEKRSPQKSRGVSAGAAAKKFGASTAARERTAPSGKKSAREQSPVAKGATEQRTERAPWSSDPPRVSATDEATVEVEALDEREAVAALDAAIARDAETLKEAKANHMAHSLLRAARLWNEQAIARVRARGFANARLSHTQVLPHLDLEGTRLTDLAARLDVTKQAAQQLINELEEAGLVERVPDPSDGRAKLIRFTAFGRRSILDGLDVLRGIEDELRRDIGDHAVDVLGAGLAKVVAFLEGRQKV